VAHAKFIPDIEIVQGEIGDYEVRDQKFLKHVRANLTCTALLVRTKDFQARDLKCRFNQFGIDSIEVDLNPLAVFLRTKRHHDKGVWLHTFFLSIESC